MAQKSLDSYRTRSQLKVGGKSYVYSSLSKLKSDNVNRLPFCHKILLENLLRNEDGITVTKSHIDAFLSGTDPASSNVEIQFLPARILLQDFTGVPVAADLAAMRGAIRKLGGDPSRVNPLQPVDLVIDHSVQVDYYGTPKAFEKNAELEFDRNQERYEFLKWGQTALKNFRVVPPDTGIVHQVNLEFLARLAMTGKKEKATWVYPDSLVGTDSHTTMINGLGVLAWGVGGIEAEAAMLGQPIPLLIPQVVGFRLTGNLPSGTTATDLVLTVTEMLRKKGVVGKFVEFFGPGLKNLGLADRATIANMAPEYGATVGIFPVDEKTTDYLKLTAREKLIPLVEKYFQAQGMWNDEDLPEAHYSDTLELDLSKIEPCLAGPSRPQDRVILSKVKSGFIEKLSSLAPDKNEKPSPDKKVPVEGPKATYDLQQGAVLIAAITSCTNTSNPFNLIAAGLLAKKAVEKGLKVHPWVKTSLAPGSKVVTRYLESAGLMPFLEKLGFHLVGYGCTTCIGNSGPIAPELEKAVNDGKMVICSVLSGNRNFEGRISPSVRANYLASPPLVVAYALAGNIQVNLTQEPIGKGKDGKPVYLKDVWPTPDEINGLIRKHVTNKDFKKGYSDIFDGGKNWKSLKFPKGDLYKWDTKSTYIKEPPFFEGITKNPHGIEDIQSARPLGLFLDSVTTDHISPAGSIKKDSPAGQYLMSLGIDVKDFNSYGARRGNHEVMVRGTFANVRIKNQMLYGMEGGYTKHYPDGKQMTIYEAAMQYQSEKTPLVVMAGKEYGTGSSRDWAAKGTQLLGVRAVIAESFERIHRSNLIGMGVLPLQFEANQNWKTLGIDGSEKFDILGLSQLKPGATVEVKVTKQNGASSKFRTVSRIDTPKELDYFLHGGILPYVLRQLL